MRIRPRWILAFFALAALLYLSWGYTHFGANRQRVAARAARAQADQGPVQVAVLWTAQPPNDFLAGCEVGAQLNSQGLPRPFELVPFQVDSEALRSYEQRLSALLTRHPRVVAVVAAVPDELVSKTEVICESFGVALLLSNLETPLMATPGFQFTARMNPNYTQYAREAITALSTLASRGPEDNAPIRVGIFFNARAPFGSEGVNRLLEESETQNASVTFVRSLRREVALGAVDGNIPLRQLRDDLAFQVGLTRQTSVVQSFLRDFASSNELENDLPLAEALRRAAGLRHKIKIEFVQSYLPSHQDYRPMLSRLPLVDLDVVVLASDLSGTSTLIHQLRANECQAPLLCLDYQRPDVIAASLGEKARPLFMIANHDPGLVAQSHPELLEAFRARLSREPDRFEQLGEMGLMGYDSFGLLAEVIRETGRSVPQEIINTLKFSSQAFETLEDRFTFDQDGAPQGRKLHLLEYQGGRVQKVEPRREREAAVL